MAARGTTFLEITMSTTIPTTAQVAASLERTARIAAPFIAFLVTAIILLAELSYALGYQLGSAVHARNDQLAGFWHRLWASEPEVLAEPAAAPMLQITVKQSTNLSMPAAPAVHPLALLTAELESMTCKQLQTLIGTRRRCSKSELVAAYLAA